MRRARCTAHLTTTTDRRAGGCDGWTWTDVLELRSSVSKTTVIFAIVAIMAGRTDPDRAHTGSLPGVRWRRHLVRRRLTEHLGATISMLLAPRGIYPGAGNTRDGLRITTND